LEVILKSAYVAVSDETILAQRRSGALTIAYLPKSESRPNELLDATADRLIRRHIYPGH
jgi:hypothetical protein